MNLFTITAYLFAALFLIFLTRAVWAVLPIYFPGHLLWRRKTNLAIYKFFGYEEFVFWKEKRRYMVMAKSRKAAYHKLKKHTTKTNRKGNTNL